MATCKFHLCRHAGDQHIQVPSGCQEVLGWSSCRQLDTSIVVACSRTLLTLVRWLHFSWQFEAYECGHGDNFEKRHEFHHSTRRNLRLQQASQHQSLGCPVTNGMCQWRVSSNIFLSSHSVWTRTAKRIDCDVVLPLDGRLYQQSVEA